MIKIGGDAAVSEQKVVETTAMSSPEKKEESEKKSTSTKKAASKKQSRGTARAKIVREQGEKEISLFKENIYIVFVECETPGNVGFLARTMANFGLKNLVLINPPKLTNDAYYQATHGKYIVENAMVFKTLDEFYQSQRIDFKVASTGTVGGSYNLARIPIRPEELGKSLNVSNKIAILFGREGDGLSNKEIAGKLFLSEGTVRNALSSILSKLGLRDRTQLAIWAIQSGMMNEEIKFSR